MNDGAQRFGQVEFDPSRGRLRVAGRRVELDRFSLAILAILVAEAGREVGKDRLLDAAWPGRLVHENSLAKAISRLRAALGEDGDAIETLHGLGYRLSAEPRAAGSPAAGEAELSSRPRRLRRPAILVAAVATTVLATTGLVAFAGAGRNPPRRVINGEAADAVGRVLWVDDHPENNIGEKRYLEAHKIAVYQVGTTRDALTLLPMYQYRAVISDMGRGERPLAGMDLLKQMRARGDRRPFLIYTVHSSAAQRRLVAETGGQGVAVKRDELYAAILPLFGLQAVEDD
jgi:DNA-binding response OmpR family regulator